ncbi:DUF5316 domain-containing protein [Aquibacillus saliphilus]|uniref:DUF5316 domain-containing protein n=1 Tax=Aquibacillus saliphilus TaxID=1909422 RepID=UPI001CF07C99|nr:DUF5316 domain-containing protein [Aquibacillus saliphilus]
MLKYIGIGVFITLVALVIGSLTGDWNLFLKIVGVAALIPLLISGLLTGAFVDGDRNRANYHTENKEDRQQKNKWVIRFLLISTPNLAILITLVVIGLMQG